MVKRLISAAMRSTIEEMLSKPLYDLAEGQKRIVSEQQSLREAMISQSARIDALGQRIDAQGARLDQRIDSLGTSLADRIDAQGARLDQKMDGLSFRIDSLSTRIDGLGSRMEEFSAKQSELIVEVASLKRDRDSTDDHAHRLTRIEDRVFSQAS